MPPRSFTWAIIVFWLATAGWLFYREFWPRFQADRPPRLAISFADEVRTSSVRWTIYRDKEPIGSPRKVGKDNRHIGSGRTQFRPLKDRTFELSCEFDFNNLDVLGRPVQKITSSYRVGRKGDLRALDTAVAIEIDPKMKPLQVGVQGKVENGLFIPRLQTRGLGGAFDRPLELDPVPVATDESFVNPMHPLDTIPGLWAGQRWRQPLVDPLADAVTARFGIAVKPQYYEAEVSRATLEPDRQAEDCLVIDYREPGKKKVLARTWVRAADATVQRQEAAFQGTRLVMDRGTLDP